MRRPASQPERETRRRAPSRAVAHARHFSAHGHLRAAMAADGCAHPRGGIHTSTHGDFAMPWKRLSALAVALVLAGALSAEAIAQRWDRDWVLLGERVVTFRAERDAINVTQTDD